MSECQAIRSEMSRQWMWDMLEKLGIGAYRIDYPGGSVTECNGITARMMGFESPSQVIGTMANAYYIDPKEREETVNRLIPEIEKRGFLRLEVKRKRHDTGELIDVLISLAAVYDNQGRLIGTDCLMEKINDRRHTEKAFKASEERFRVLFETSTVGMLITDTKGKIARVNGSFQNFIGRSEAELINANFIDLIFTEDKPKTYGIIYNNGSERHCFLGAQWRFAKSDGRIMHGQVSNSWLFEDGIPHSNVLIIQDITNSKQMEQTILRMEKLEAVGRLAGGIAHDFNNILTTVLGNVSLAKNETQDERISNFLAQAEDAIFYARSMTKELISFSSDDTPDKKVIRIDQIIKSVATIYLIGTKTVIEYNVDRDLKLCEVAPDLICRVFQNLLINASEAMSGSGIISVDVKNYDAAAEAHPVLLPGEYVKIMISDMGNGISEEVLPRIFDAYFSTKRQCGGLGLASVLSIVKRHGGHIEVASKVGLGTTFTLFFPAVDVAEKVEEKEENGNPSVSPERVRVLVMDDDESVRKVVKKMLEQMGLDVSEAGDGAGALLEYEKAVAEHSPFAFVMLDLTVNKGLGGLETMRKLKAVDPSVRAVVSSGFPSDMVMADFERYGFVSVIQKPFAYNQLLDVVKRVLAGPEIS